MAFSRPDFQSCYFLGWIYSENSRRGVWEIIECFVVVPENKQQFSVPGGTRLGRFSKPSRHTHWLAKKFHSWEFPRGKQD
jgi:hypothetical protein